jgi:hypothetical protein
VTSTASEVDGSVFAARSTTAAPGTLVPAARAHLAVGGGWSARTLGATMIRTRPRK